MDRLDKNTNPREQQPAPADKPQSLREVSSPSETEAREDSKLVLESATAFHEAWRSEWQGREENTPETPRWKATSDAAWARKNADAACLRVKEGGEVEVNINIAFEDLPQDWQKDNLEAAELAVSTARQAIEEQWLDSPDYEQKAGARIHEMWCDRRREKEADSPEFQALDIPFGELDGWRQEQDTVQARIVKTILSTESQREQAH